MSYTKRMIDEEMEQGNDLLAVPDDGDFDYERKRHEHYTAQPTGCTHDYQPAEGGGYICLLCEDYVSPEDVQSGLDEMRSDEERTEGKQPTENGL